MKYLAWIIGLFAGAVVLTYIAHNPGYVLLVYPPYRVELSLNLFIVMWLASIVLCYLAIKLCIALTGLPAQVRRLRARRAQNPARQLLDEELGAFFEGRYAAAEQAAVRAMESGDTSALHPIIAARSAHELRDYKKRDAYLSAAEGKTIGETTMRLVTTSKFMLEQRNPQGALSALQQLRNSGVKGHAGAMTLELKAHQQAGHWDEVLKLLDQLEKHSAIDPLSSAQIRQQAWLEKIQQQHDLPGLAACLKTIPTDFKRRGKIAAAAARALIDHGGCSIAQQLLSDSLNTQWDSELAALYGDCKNDDGMAQIEQAEKWLNAHKQDAGLLLALGKLCLHQQLWGKAKNYLDASNSLVPSHTACIALAKLAEQLGKPDEAFGYYQQAMRLAPELRSA